MGRWITKLGLGDATIIQTARMRRAWQAVRLYFTQAEQDRSKVTLADLDSLLEDGELRNDKQSFWKRYRLRFPSSSRLAAVQSLAGDRQAHVVRVPYLEGA